MTVPSSAPPWSVWRATTVMSRTLVAGLESALQDAANISVPDYEILHALDTAGDRQARSRDLAAMLSWEKSRLSHHVRRMEQRSLVQRMECETDLRGTWVSLTDHGDEALARARQVVDSYLADRLESTLTAAERATLAQLALKVLDGAEMGSCRVEVDQLNEQLSR